MKTLLLILLGLSFHAVSAAEDIDCENADSTPDINQCASLELAAAETIMEDYLAASRARYSDDAVSLGAIDDAHTAWLAYRKAQCASVFDIWRDGTIRTLMALDCSIQMTRDRTHALWRSFLTYVDSTPPIRPEPARAP